MTKRKIIELSDDCDVDFALQCIEESPDDFYMFKKKIYCCHENMEMLSDIALDGCRFQQQNAWGFGNCGKKINDKEYCSEHLEYGLSLGVLK